MPCVQVAVVPPAEQDVEDERDSRREPVPRKTVGVMLHAVGGSV